MKKYLIFLLVFCLLTGGAAATAQTPPQLIDGADLLTISEEAALGSLLEEISKEVEAQIAVVTADTIDGRDIDGFINEFYDENGYGYGTDRSGVLLLVCMDTREYHMLSNGEAGDAITAYEIDQIGDAIVPELSEGNYAVAFEAYAEECRYYIDRYQNDSYDEYPEEYPGDYREEYEQSAAFDVQFHLIVSLIIGLVVGGIVILVLVGQLKSVRRQDQANAYVRPGSLQLTQSGDYFMYRNVTRTAKPQNTSSGGGGSRMGGGGSRHTGGGRF